MARVSKPAEKGKRYPLNMRTTHELRKQIEAAAQASGRSLVQEVEYRLDRSFDPLFDPRHAVLFRCIAGVIALVEAQTGKRWNDDWPTALLMLEAVQSAVGSVFPDNPTREGTPTKAQILAATASQTSSARPTSSGDEPSLAEPTLRIRRSGPVGILERQDPDVQKHAAVERKSRSSAGNYSSPTLPKDSDLREHRVTKTEEGKS